MARQQLITFDLNGQVLGVDVMAVREIRAWSATTPLPNMPAYVCGVVNLRGTVLPVIDLSRLLGWGSTEPSARHVIIVVEVEGRLEGLIVDGVDDIVAIDREAMQPPPDLVAQNCRRIVEGLATVDGRMVMVLALACIEPDAIPVAEAA